MSRKKRIKPKMFEYLEGTEILKKKSSITVTVCPVLRTVPEHRQAFRKRK